MVDSISATRANSVLNAVARAAAYSESALWIQLHIGAPGAAGTSNVASNNTRQDVTSAFTTAAASGAIANTVAVEWLAVPTAETYSHFTLWTASTSGTFVGSGAVTGGTVAAGNNFLLPIAALTLTFTTAS